MKLQKIIIAATAGLALSLSCGVATAKADSVRHHASQSIAAMVNINTADAKTLDTLKRIGLKKAQAIVAYREEHGRFKSVEDLTKVKGISEKTLEMNKGLIVVS